MPGHRRPGPRSGSSSPGRGVSGAPSGSSSRLARRHARRRLVDRDRGEATMLLALPGAHGPIPSRQPADDPAAPVHRLARMARVLTFLSDYGHDDDFVGVCHGVIARIAPDARVIDVTHGIAAPRHPLRRARAARARCRTSRRASTSPSSTPRSAPSARAVALRTRRRGPRPRRPRQRPAAAGRPALRRRRRGGRHRALAAPPRADVGDVPRPRRLRPGGRAPRAAARRSPRRATRSRPTSSSRSKMPEARSPRTGARRPRGARSTASATSCSTSSTTRSASTGCASATRSR